MTLRTRGRLATAIIVAGLAGALAIGSPSALAEPEVPQPAPIDPAAAPVPPPDPFAPPPADPLAPPPAPFMFPNPAHRRPTRWQPPNRL